jgi:DNA-binding transcriptional LysR family regulator
MAAATHAPAEIRSAAAHEVTMAVQRDIASQFVSTRLSVFATKYPALRVYNMSMGLEESAATNEMVRHGVCIACPPHCSVADELATHSLASLRLARALSKMELRCAHTGALSANARLLLNELRKGKHDADGGAAVRRR